MNFVLDRANSDEPTFIIAKKDLADGTFRYSTKKKIHPRDWNKKSQRASPSAKDRELIRVCNNINGLLDSLAAAYAELSRDGKPTKNEVMHAFNDLLGHSTNNRATGFFDIINLIIEDRRQGRELTSKSTIYAEGTIKSYDNTVAVLKEYEAARNLQLSFHDFTDARYRDLMAWLTSEDHSKGYISKLIKELKTFFFAAHRRGYHKNDIILKRIMKIQKDDTFDIYLTEDKITKIYETETFWEGETLARDWFVLDCFMGLRVSDLTMLAGSQSQDFTTLHNIKTGERVVLPMHWTAKDIFKRYGGKYPPKITDQNINKNIKNIAKRAGLTNIITYSIIKGGKVVEKKDPEHQMISNHTARRSFITNLLKIGFTASQVMKLAGIKSLATLEKYNKVTPEEVAEMAAKHSYFLTPTEKPKE